MSGRIALMFAAWKVSAGAAIDCRIGVAAAISGAGTP
jgi:hypothetical protein